MENRWVGLALCPFKVKSVRIAPAPASTNSYPDGSECVQSLNKLIKGGNTGPQNTSPEPREALAHDFRRTSPQDFVCWAWSGYLICWTSDRTYSGFPIFMKATAKVTMMSMESCIHSVTDFLPTRRRMVNW